MNENPNNNNKKNSNKTSGKENINNGRSASSTTSQQSATTNTSTKKRTPRVGKINTEGTTKTSSSAATTKTKTNAVAAVDMIAVHNASLFDVTSSTSKAPHSTKTNNTRPQQTQQNRVKKQPGSSTNSTNSSKNAASVNSNESSNGNNKKDNNIANNNKSNTTRGSRNNNYNNKNHGVKEDNVKSTNSNLVPSLVDVKADDTKNTKTQIDPSMRKTQKEETNQQQGGNLIGITLKEIKDEDFYTIDVPNNNNNNTVYYKCYLCNRLQIKQGDWNKHLNSKQHTGKLKTVQQLRNKLLDNDGDKYQYMTAYFIDSYKEANKDQICTTADNNNNSKKATTKSSNNNNGKQQQPIHECWAKWSCTICNTNINDWMDKSIVVDSSSPTLLMTSSTALPLATNDVDIHCNGRSHNKICQMVKEHTTLEDLIHNDPIYQCIEVDRSDTSTITTSNIRKYKCIICSITGLSTNSVYSHCLGKGHQLNVTTFHQKKQKSNNGQEQSAQQTNSQEKKSETSMDTKGTHDDDHKIVNNNNPEQKTKMESWYDDTEFNEEEVVLNPILETTTKPTFVGDIADFNNEVQQKSTPTKPSISAGIITTTVTNDAGLESSLVSKVVVAPNPISDHQESVATPSTEIEIPVKVNNTGLAVPLIVNGTGDIDTGHQDSTVLVPTPNGSGLEDSWVVIDTRDCKEDHQESKASVPISKIETIPEVSGPVELAIQQNIPSVAKNEAAANDFSKKPNGSHGPEVIDLSQRFRQASEPTKAHASVDQRDLTYGKGTASFDEPAVQERNIAQNDCDCSCIIL